MDVTFTHLEICFQDHKNSNITSPKMMEIYDGRKLLIWKLLNYPTICKNISTKFKYINSAKNMFECFRKGGTEDTKSLFKEMVYLFFLFSVNFKSNQITLLSHHQQQCVVVSEKPGLIRIYARPKHKCSDIWCFGENGLLTAYLIKL